MRRPRLLVGLLFARNSMFAINAGQLMIGANFPTLSNFMDFNRVLDI